MGYTITFPGGDTELLGSAEYRIPIAGPVSMSLFVDAGTDGISQPGSLKLNPTGVDNINSQFPLVNQQAQLQIAPGTNFKLRMSTGIEFIINLPIVQAPFRIYYAYNPLRLHETIVAPFDQLNNQTLLSDVFFAGAARSAESVQVQFGNSVAASTDDPESGSLELF